MDSDNKNKMVCSAPWSQISILPDGRIRLCCHATVGGLYRKNNNDFFYIHKDSLEDIFSSNYIEEIRKSILKNIYPHACSNCVTNNKITSYSPSITYFEEVSSLQCKIRTLDISLGNTCNLQCIMCSSTFSTGHSKNQRKIACTFLPEFLEHKNFISLCKNLHNVLIQGGEPFLSKSHLTLIKQLIKFGNSNQIILNYITNGTIAPLDEIINLWKQFRSVKIMISLDGINETAEIIRTPMRWKSFIKTFTVFYQLHEKKIIYLDTLLTYQIFNAISFQEVSQFLIQYPKLNRIPEINILNYPRHLSIDWLPKTKKKILLDIVKKIIIKKNNSEELKRLKILEFNLLREIKIDSKTYITNFLKIKSLEKKMSANNSKIKDFFNKNILSLLE